MKLSGSYQINLEKQEVWEALNDPEILKQAIPGCDEFIKKSDTNFTAKATNKIGPFNHDDIKINSLKELYCNDNGDEDICNCIVEVIEKHTDSLIEINPNDKYILPKSIFNSYDESLTCLKLKNAESKYKEFLLEISNYEKITIPDSIKHKAHQVGEQILEKFK